MVHDGDEKVLQVDLDAGDQVEKVSNNAWE
jgi:hypothetical protein